MIFVDSNVPMYLVGNPHPNRDRVLQVLPHLASERERFVADVEVYQEIRHRYTSIGRFQAIDWAFVRLNGIAQEVLTYGMDEIRAARELIRTADGISGHDALHVEVMRSAGITRILSYDTGFEGIPGIERLS